MTCFARANAVTWRDEFGIMPHMVKVGYVPGVMEATKPVAHEDKDIDILFFGERLLPEQGGAAR